MGMGLGSRPNPGYLVASVCFLGKDNKWEKVVVVDEPVSTEKVEHVEDAVDIDSGRK